MPPAQFGPPLPPPPPPRSIPPQRYPEPMFAPGIPQQYHQELAYMMGPQREISDDLMQPEVREGIFGLIGEILLCPMKITFYLLLAIFRKEYR
jgi:hypothetical protein